MAENEDYYQILGVPKSASADDIKKAYRKLAIKYHPDRNPGNKQAEEKFKKVSRAYDILGDPQKKANYDQFGSSYFEGGPGGPGGAQGFNGFGGGFSGAQNFRNPQDIFAQFFGSQGGFGGAQGINLEDLLGGRGRRRRNMRGSDLNADLIVTFDEAFSGVEKEIRTDHTIKTRIPAGIKDGAKLRLAGEGNPAPNGGENGDLFVTVHLMPNPVFSREGQDVICELPVPLELSVAGGVVEVPTLSGKVKMKVPAGSQSGARMRLRGRGFPALRGGTAGDQIVVLKVEIPSGLTKQQTELLKYFTDSLTPQNMPVQNEFAAKAAKYMKG